MKSSCRSWHALLFYWEKERGSPPVYGLLTFEIKEEGLGKKDSIYYVRISFILYFLPENPLLSGKEGEFKLIKPVGLDNNRFPYQEVISSAVL